MSRDSKQRCMALARWCPLMTMLFTCTDGVRSAEMVTPKSRQEVTKGRRLKGRKSPILRTPPSFNAPAQEKPLKISGRNLLMKTRGHSLYGENCMILASTVFEILAASRSEIANFAYRDLETRVRGHSRSLLLVPMESACTYSYY